MVIQGYSNQSRNYLAALSGLRRRIWRRWKVRPPNIFLKEAFYGADMTGNGNHGILGIEHRDLVQICNFTLSL